MHVYSNHSDPTLEIYTWPGLVPSSRIPTAATTLSMDLFGHLWYSDLKYGRGGGGGGGGGGSYLNYCNPQVWKTSGLYTTSSSSTSMQHLHLHLSICNQCCVIPIGWH